MIPVARPWLDEQEAEAARRAILSGWVTQGPEVAAFEREFAAYSGTTDAVQTGIDIRLQRAANRAIDRGLRLVDKRRGYRRDKPNVVAQGIDVDGYRHERWAQPIADKYGYDVRFLPTGPEDSAVGAPTQMAVFEEI